MSETQPSVPQPKVSAPQILPHHIKKNLADRSYEKRKSAALEVERIVKEYNADDKKDGNKINMIIDVLVKEYAYSTQANSRKGGLIGLAATAIALMDDVGGYLNRLLPPVLKCFEDQQSRVRYYACEALYNITKVARGSVLVFFNEIFDGLCKLFMDLDMDVKNGAQLLDRLTKDVVAETESFHVEKFIPLLRERIRVKDPFIRQLIVGWITVLDSVPDIDILVYLPEFLGGLFEMLSDVNKDIRQQAYSALQEFLHEIKDNVKLDLGPMVGILVKQCEMKDQFTRLTALCWIYEFIELGKIKLLPFLADMLGVVLLCISDEEEEIRLKANMTNKRLLKLVESTTEKFAIKSLLNKITTHLVNKYVPTRLASLQWISMMLAKKPDTMFKHLPKLFPSLLDTLSDPDDKVVRLDLKVLARICINKEHFDVVLNNLINRFKCDRRLLETRGSLIVRQLSVLLDGESIYRAFAIIILKEVDLEFASLMVQTLNLILLTSSELFELRGLLKNSLSSKQSNDLFLQLYQAWSHNAVSTFSLCLLAQMYELGSELVQHMADTEVTVGFLMQVDKLVQLIESPIFIQLRLQLLEPHKYPFLLKSLYGLLMLLPQSSAFACLKNRLDSVSTLGILNTNPATSNLLSGQSKEMKKSGAGDLDVKTILNQFREMQLKHSERRKHIFKQHSLRRRQQKEERKGLRYANHNLEKKKK
mmetsp:Transcript_717/g.1057  ORF Transcript_717/g.1057 Transcript_717/m.1057 type:complete len:705 (-) Transcript_717:240-2354(-)|eukprot:CAMPEP_0184486032 /NCGR_PEP_ID=MMETSP0113_2-20130426/7568_1 /TAXON_ID=91329 /ORGANISM="Norrisiella sphaerica, Strain BC52" /LENGTH=704 /DNA_ID=CAMNT_0026867733 /DNA_START=660 /DNA_END=2774 /DNA_ORIENTATION=-